MIFHRIFTLLFLAAFIGTVSAHAQTKDDKISLSERVFITSKIYASIPMYFGHFQAVPDFDLDAEYKKYVEQAMGSDDRAAFDLGTMEFIAKLKNGHTDFTDDWLDENRGQPLGFRLGLVGNEWTVIRTSLDALTVGDVVESVDGVPIKDFVAQRLKYVAASNDAGRMRLLFARPFLFPTQFTLKLKTGKTVSINRREQKLQTPAAPRPLEGKLLEGNVAYLYIPSFEDPQNQEKAIEFVRQNAAARALIIDVRGNGGGSTPAILLRALIDRPYQNWATSTPLSIGVFGANAQLKKIVPLEQLGERTRGYVQALSEYSSDAQLLIPGGIVKPEKPIYTNPIILLTDGGCASACEDFTMPLKTSGRARLVGQNTFGSSGQPFIYDFGNGMGFRVSSRRMYFPDGSQFEGVGIKPDVLIEPTVGDIRNKTDVFLTKALELINAVK